MRNQDTEIKVFSFRKFVIAFFIGAVIDFLRRLIESTYGPFDIIFYSIYCWFYSIIFTGLVAVIGLLFYIPKLKKLWFENKLPFSITTFLGVAFFLFGITAAHYVYFDMQKSGKEADNYLDYFARPGFILILFSICFLPTKLFKTKSKISKMLT